MENKVNFNSYLKIFSRYSNMDIYRTTFKYSLEELNNIYNTPRKIFSLIDKIEEYKKLLHNIDYVEEPIKNSIKCNFKNNFLFFFSVHLSKNGELLFTYQLKKVIDKTNVCLFEINDFKKKYINIENYLKETFSEFYIEEPLFEKLFKELKELNQSKYNPYSFNADTEVLLQDKFKKTILFEFIRTNGQINIKEIRKIKENQKNPYLNWMKLVDEEKVLNDIKKIFKKVELSKSIIIDYINYKYEKTIKKISDNKKQNPTSIKIFNNCSSENIYEVLEDYKVLYKDTYELYLKELVQ